MPFTVPLDARRVIITSIASNVEKRYMPIAVKSTLDATTTVEVNRRSLYL